MTQNTETAPLYDRIADWFDDNRGRSGMEAPYLSRITDTVPDSGTVLDIGCGAGEPIARYFIDKGWSVTGVDFSVELLAKSRARFPAQEWLHADMRKLSLGRRFDAVLAWDSFFHLTADDQRAMFGVFAAHLKPGGQLLFNTGTEAGTSYGEMNGQSFHHASLDVAEYRSLLAKHGFMIMLCDITNPACGGRTVWMASYAPDAENDKP
ncbi:MAG TPA: class I SAM-dependent methyltransferase [Alphaproteobacteria bacterium]|nr:class I SAM-dependent methyltransferase [Alphaproteobacteria bacterium]